MRFLRNLRAHAQAERDPRFRAGLRTEAAQVQRHAQATVHSVMPASRNPSIEVQEDAEGVAVVNTDHGAHIDEYGSINNPPYAPLRRAVRAAGLRLDEAPK